MIAISYPLTVIYNIWQINNIDHGLLLRCIFFCGLSLGNFCDVLFLSSSY